MPLRFRPIRLHRTDRRRHTSRYSAVQWGLSAIALGCIGSGTSALAHPMELIGATPEVQPAQFELVLPLRNHASLSKLLVDLHDPHSTSYHHWLSPAEFETRFGAAPATIALATAELRAHGLQFTRTGRIIHVQGHAGAIGRFVGAPLVFGKTEIGTQRIFANGAIQLPSTLTAAGIHAFGLGRDPHLAHVLSHRVAVPQNRSSATGTYWYDDLKQAYQYPSYQTMITVNGKKQRLDGTGSTIGILMSSDILDSDIKMMFDHENFTKNSGQPSDPSLYARVAVDGGSNTQSQALDEASLDVQEALTGAPGAHVMLYEIPDLSDDHIMDAYNQIVSDNKTDVVSSSFGGCELAYTAAYNNGTDETAILEQQHEIFEQGNAQGITFLASSGDSAGLGCPDSNYVNYHVSGQYVAGVETPAADPAVTAVGGTNVVTSTSSTSLDSSYTNENAYSDPLLPNDPYNQGALLFGGYWGAGGGKSTIYAKPDYQTNAGINTGSSSYRALPDIGMQVGGCPGTAIQPCNGGNQAQNGNGNSQRSSVYVAINGQFQGLIGTSVSSPEFSGVAAILIELKGRMGNLNYYLYNLGTAQSHAGTTVYHRAIPGYNGVVSTSTPSQSGNAYYNYEVGNGTPIVYRLLGLNSAMPAGLPQTPSNP